MKEVSINHMGNVRVGDKVVYHSTPDCSIFTILEIADKAIFTIIGFYDCSTWVNLLDESKQEHLVKKDTFFKCFKLLVEGTEESKEDMVNHPSHYTWLKEKCGIEVIDITRHLDFCIGNSVKYLLRAGYKKDSSLTDKEKEIEDLKKAIFYINDKIQQLEERNGNKDS